MSNNKPHSLRLHRQGTRSAESDLDPYRRRLANEEQRFTIELEALPLGGRIVLVEPKNDEADGSGSRGRSISPCRNEGRASGPLSAEHGPRRRLA